MFERLQSPLQLGRKTVTNRVMQVATGNNLEDAHRIGPRAIAFYEERARYGIGSIVVAGPLPSDRSQVAGFAALADTLHRYGTLVLGQLNERGSEHHQSFVPTLRAPSAIACPHSGGTPHPFDLAEIEAQVALFIRAAENLRDAGFDGVEVHGGQGHLIQLFLSPFSNQRDDRYGGSFENRLRFAVEIIDGIRRVCGAGFIVGFRLGAEEFTPGGLTFDQAREIARHVAAAGTIDYLSVTQSNFNSLETHTPDRRYDFAPFVDFAAGIRAVTNGLPIVASGRIVDPEHAEEILVHGKADLIGLCRPLLADAEWFSKAAAGQPDRIRRCISCNQCWGWVVTSKPIGCVQNAACGNELKLGFGTLERATVAKAVVVVGGGPAGLEAARIAAERGHRVTLFEQQARLGGELLDAATVPGYEELQWLADYLTGAVREVGVDLRLETRATAEMILAERPDAVVIATGAEPKPNDLGDPNGVAVYNYHDVLRGNVQTGRAAVVLDDDGYYGSCAVAEKLAHNGTKVHLVTRFFEVGREIPATSRTTTLRALDRLGVTLVPTAWLGGISGRNVTLQHYCSGREWMLEDITCVVHAANRQPSDALRWELEGRVAAVECIGDAYMPRRIADAIREGNRTGRAL